MADFNFIDNDVLSSLSQEAVNYNPTAIDIALVPGSTAVITTTVYGEATRFAHRNEFSAFRKAWLDANIAAGRIILEPTPGFPVGVKNAGELSMLSVGLTKYAGQSVTYVSNDNFFLSEKIGDTGLSPINLIDGQTHNTGQEFLLKSLTRGGLSLAEYYVSSANLERSTNESPIITPDSSGIVSDGAAFIAGFGSIAIIQSNGETVIINAFERFIITTEGTVEVIGIFDPRTGEVNPPRCFLAGTQVAIGGDLERSIESIHPGDMVTAYDKDGNLKPAKVTAVHVNQVDHILDVHGLMVTPGHHTLCGDGPYTDKHVPIIDILRTDGAMVREDGTKVRAATGCDLNSEDDQFVWAITGDQAPDGTIKVRDKGRIRLGTRVISSDGRDISVRELIKGAGGTVTSAGLIARGEGGANMPFLWTFSTYLPKPEDYVLQRSGLTLMDLYSAAGQPVSDLSMRQ